MKRSVGVYEARIANEASIPGGNARASLKRAPEDRLRLPAVHALSRAETPGPH